MVAAQQADLEVQNRIEAEATKRSGKLNLVQIEREKQKQKSDQEENATKQDEDDTTSRGSVGGRSDTRS